MKIYVARILFPVRVLGPGDRIGLWLAGCGHKCRGCSNPELWDQKEEWKMDTSNLIHLIRKIAASRLVDGFTITGGDPFDQPEALRELLCGLKDVSEDILVYTGYRFADIRDKHRDVLENVSVLIDGPYIEERNHGQRLRGSDNQRIIYLKPDVKQTYLKYLRSKHADIQNFSMGDSVISVGIHLPGFHDALEEKAKEKGLIKNEQ